MGMDIMCKVTWGEVVASEKINTRVIYDGTLAIIGFLDWNYPTDQQLPKFLTMLGGHRPYTNSTSSKQ